VHLKTGSFSGDFFIPKKAEQPEGGVELRLNVIGTTASCGKSESGVYALNSIFSGANFYVHACDYVDGVGHPQS
jgi:hypothetical protein